MSMHIPDVEIGAHAEFFFFAPIRVTTIEVADEGME